MYLVLGTDCIINNMKPTFATFSNEHIATLCAMALENIKIARNRKLELAIDKCIRDNTKTKKNWFIFGKLVTTTITREQALEILKEEYDSFYSRYDIITSLYEGVEESFAQLNTLVNGPVDNTDIKIDDVKYHLLKTWANYK